MSTQIKLRTYETTPNLCFALSDSIYLTRRLGFHPIGLGTKFTYSALLGQYGTMTIIINSRAEIKYSVVEAKKFKVHDIQLKGYTIRIVDAQQNPIEEVEFNVSWDGGNPTTKETNEKGIISISKPNAGISLSLIGKKESTSDSED